VLINGLRRNRYNHAIYNCTRKWKYTRWRKLQWVGHVMRMKDEKVPKKALEGYTKGGKPAGRPRGGW
jgi:ribosomal 50S subunit-associated protein YjgA (DUF615 family)